jgi:hypothetical protein
MKIIKYFLIAFLISGCTTVPVVPKFPQAPEIMMEKCPALKPIEGETVSIIDFTKIVTENYTTYYECAIKQDAWIEWYQSQKRIYESIK